MARRYGQGDKGDRQAMIDLEAIRQRWRVSPGGYGRGLAANLPHLQQDIPDLIAEVERLHAAIREVFSIDPSMAQDGCDIIGHTIIPLSKETRLAIINTLRP